MNEELIQILGLPEGSDDKAIIAAAKALKKTADTQSNKDAGEKEITELIQKSGGALNRTSASMVLKDRKGHAKRLAGAESAKEKKEKK
jgi:hypothetical protein